MAKTAGCFAKSPFSFNQTIEGQNKEQSLTILPQTGQMLSLTVTKMLSHLLPSLLYNNCAYRERVYNSAIATLK